MLEFNFLQNQRRHCISEHQPSVPQLTSEAESASVAHLSVTPAALEGLTEPDAPLQLCPIIDSRIAEYRPNPVCWLCKGA